MFTSSHAPASAQSSRKAIPFLASALLLGALLGATISLAQATREPRVAPLESAQGINIIRTLAKHPDLSAAWTPFAGYILQGNTLPARDREMLILRTGFLRDAAYEWGHHARIARELGFSDEEILGIAKGANASVWSSFERALIRAADELNRDAYISERTWAYLDARYDEKQLIDVIFTVGQYNLVSMVVKTLRIELDEGLEAFPEVD